MDRINGHIGHGTPGQETAPAFGPAATAVRVHRPKGNQSSLLGKAAVAAPLFDQSGREQL